MNIRAFRTLGFTLTEMAVVLVIIALMIGGLLMPLSAQRNVEARRDTTRALENIREALLGFTVSHGRLPCPAESDLATGAAGAGLEAFDGNNCTCVNASGSIAKYGSANTCASNMSVSGVMPWATLGLPETDGWNNRFTYAVSTAYARLPSTGNSAYCDPGSTAPAIMPNTAAFALCTSGVPRVYTSADHSVPLTSNYEVPAVVVSHGDNGLGAWFSAGKQHALSTVSDEQDNEDSGSSFVSNTAIDDMLIWISRPILMNRMIAAGKLP